MENDNSTNNKMENDNSTNNKTEKNFAKSKVSKLSDKEKPSFMNFVKCVAIRYLTDFPEDALTESEVVARCIDPWMEFTDPQKKRFGENDIVEKIEGKQNLLAKMKSKKRQSSKNEEENDEPKKKKKSGEGKAKKEKKEKDPNMPKHPHTAYNLYISGNYQKYLDEHSDLKMEKHKFILVHKELSAKWKTLSLEEKSPYEEEARKSKAEYDQKMVEYNKLKSQENASNADASATSELELLESIINPSENQVETSSPKATVNLWEMFKKKTPKNFELPTCSKTEVIEVAPLIKTEVTEVASLIKDSFAE